MAKPMSDAQISNTSSNRQPLLLLLTLATVAMAALLWSFHAPVLWAGILAMMFHPLRQACLQRWPDRSGLASGVSLLGMLVCVILPLGFIANTLTHQVASLVHKLQAGPADASHVFHQLFDALPGPVVQLLHLLGIDDFSQMRDQSLSWLRQGGQLIAAQTLSFGQNTVNVLMNVLITLYLAFFFSRDGKSMKAVIARALPLHAAQRQYLFEKFTMVIKATVRGGFAVALVQGILGGLAFWYLGITAPMVWAVMMAISSLIPAVGAALIWLPVAMFLALTGQALDATLLTLWGVFAIGMVDNFLRPLLVGKDAGIPDFLVLLSTLGGLPWFGIHSFVIGPLIAAMFFAVWDLYIRVRQIPAPAQVSEAVNHDH
jgi:predicted PurR-regulated permease PerM